MRSAAIIAWLFLAGAPAAAAEEGNDPPRDALILFVASWCAPCQAEVRALPRIAAAAAPMHVFVAPVDDTRGTERMMARVPVGQRWRMTPDAAMAAMRRLAGAAPGLPISVATDAKGQVCAVARTPVTPVLAAEVKRRCGVREAP